MYMESGMAVVFLPLLLYGIGGWSFSISREDDLEIGKELARLNKPAIKTILTDHKELYDCVDFYKQPAFDHPLLSNHTFHFQMRPSVYPTRSIHKQHYAKIGKNGSSKGINCPIGTVPIKRITKEDLIRAKMHEQMYGYNVSPFAAEQPGLHHAIVRTKLNPSTMYNGGGMVISVEMPKAQEAQYSAGRIRFTNGPDSIEVGWMVNPTLYGDNRTRLFISLKTMNSSCFNTLCPGFILVRSDYPVDQIMEPVSHSGGPLYIHRFFIYRDKITGNWYLERGGKDYTIVGFWPQKIFSNTGLQGSASFVDWGGEVFSPPNMPSPKMGRGDISRGSLKFDAFCMEITTINEDNVEVDAQNTEAYTDRAKCYWAKDRGIVEGSMRHVITYGGLGGCTGY